MQLLELVLTDVVYSIYVGILCHFLILQVGQLNEVGFGYLDADTPCKDDEEEVSLVVVVEDDCVCRDELVPDDGVHEVLLLLLLQQGLHKDELLEVSLHVRYVVVGAILQE